MPWKTIAKAAELDLAEQPHAFTADGLKLALFEVEGEVHCIGNICTHADACLSDGFQDGHVIECPLHEGRFDIRTGAALGPPVDDPVATYKVRVEDGDIQVELP